MTKHYYKTALPIALIFSIRMLGLFMLIPVFTLYADELTGATPKLIGLALGIYGLAQAIFQIPLGALSDKIGRKKVIAGGLVLFTIGSLVAAVSHSITGMIIARALQGTGAIGSTLIALTADLTRDEDRTKSMALIGLSIGLSFSLAIIISPPLAKHFHLSGLFYIMSTLGVLGLIVLFTVVPSPKKEVFHSDSEPVPQLFKKVLQDSELLRLDFGIFCQHAILTSTFFAIPMLLENKVTHLWLFYLPILVVSFLCMIPFIIIAEKKFKMKKVFCLAIGLSVVSQLILTFYYDNLTLVFIVLTLYFIGFNILEASLPSLVSKTSRISAKGTAMGVYSTSQFLGIFVGGIMAGYLYHSYSYQGIFFSNTLFGIVWCVLAFTMKAPKHLSTKLISVEENIDIDNLNQQLRQEKGVIDSHVTHAERTIHLKIDRKVCDWQQVNQIAKQAR